MRLKNRPRDPQDNLANLLPRLAPEPGPPERRRIL